DLVLRNGVVWCGRHAPKAEAIAVWQGRVLATGSSSDIDDLIGSATEVIDLDGRLATPGLNDSHLHLLSLGPDAMRGNVRPAVAPTLTRLLCAIRRRAEVLPPGEWIVARGYDQTKLDTGRHPNREELDQAAPHHPVVLVRTCGHIAICNSRALALAGIG